MHKQHRKAMFLVFVLEIVVDAIIQRGRHWLQNCHGQHPQLGRESSQAEAREPPGKWWSLPQSPGADAHRLNIVVQELERGQVELDHLELAGGNYSTSRQVWWSWSIGWWRGHRGKALGLAHASPTSNLRDAVLKYVAKLLHFAVAARRARPSLPQWLESPAARYHRDLSQICCGLGQALAPSLRASQEILNDPEINDNVIMTILKEMLAIAMIIFWNIAIA